MFCGMGFASLKARKKVDMNPDEVINIYKDKLGRPPSLEVVEKGRKETLKKVFKAIPSFLPSFLPAFLPSFLSFGTRLTAPRSARTAFPCCQGR